MMPLCLGSRTRALVQGAEALPAVRVWRQQSAKWPLFLTEGAFGLN